MTKIGEKYQISKTISIFNIIKRYLELAITQVSKPNIGDTYGTHFRLAQNCNLKKIKVYENKTIYLFATLFFYYYYY